MPTEIHPGVYDITIRQDDNGRRYRVYLVEDDVPTLVDTGFADTTDALFEGIEATGLEPERVVITHADTDHVEGLPAVVDAYDVETHVPELSDVDDVEPDHRYGDGDRIGGFEAVYLPGHTSDHHALVHEDAGFLITGDALSGADLRGFPEGYLLPHAAVYAENLQESELNLDRLLEYDFDAALVFHGSAVTENARDALDRYVNFPGRPAENIR
jgi:glyoxylase-like metal-dependent hydrolase (beta-lactamase superfamily II)